MATRRALTGGQQGAALMLAAGALTLVNNYLPGSGHLDIAALNTIGVLALAIGAVAWRVPWERWPARTSLVLAPIALGMIASANYLGGVSSYSYAVYFVVIFVWVGLAHPPGTVWLLLAPAVAAYVVPLLMNDDSVGVSSVTVAIPVCVLVSETIARTTERRRIAQDETQLREVLTNRLVEVIADVNAVLDPDLVLPRLCEGARTLLGVEAAAYIEADDGMATIAAVAGLPPALFVGQSYSVDDGSIAEVLQTRTTRVVTNLDEFPLMVDEVRMSVPGLHSLVAVPCVGGDLVHGALYVAIGAQRPALSLAEHDVLRELASHVVAALRNAAAYDQALRQQLHELAVIDSMSDGLAVIDRELRVRSWNAAAGRLTGIATEDVLGEPMPLQYELGKPVQHRMSNGTWVELLASQVEPEQEIVVSIRDVSAAKALEEAKDLFLATTSHELRTPLTVIQGFVATLEQRWREMPEEMRDEALRTIHERTRSIIELVDHLLLSARAGANRNTLVLVPTDLLEVLATAVRDMDAVSPLHEVLLEAPADLPVVEADTTALEHVFNQLLENAVKYSPDGGTIAVEARAEDGEVVVRVCDRGIGIRPGSEQSIFESFVQAEAGDSRTFGGVGLGLHIVRTLVTSMKGTVAARSRDGGGAEFEVRLQASRWQAGR